MSEAPLAGCGTARTEIIHDDEELQVLRREGASSFTLVTFADMMFRSDQGSFWGRAPAESLDLDCIGLVPRRPNWYPLASMVRAARAIRRAAKPVRIGYGYSMGGYGALKHGALLGLTHALSVAPQTSIDPGEVPEDVRYRRFFRPELHRDMGLRAADLAPWAAVVGDPWDGHDGPHLARMAELPVHRVATPFLGHWAIHLLTGTAVLDNALRHVLAGDAAGLRRLVRGNRRGSPVWHRMVGIAAVARGHEALAAQLWQRAPELRLQPPAVKRARALGLFERSRRLRAAGQAEAAAAALRAGIDIMPRRHLPALIEGGRVLIAQGETAASEPLFRAAILLDAYNRDALLGLSRVAFAAGRQDEALALAERAAEGGGDHNAFAWLGALLGGQGRKEEAIGALRAALALDASLANAHCALIRLLRGTRQSRAARQALDAALKACPADPALRALAAEMAGPWRRLWRG